MRRRALTLAETLVVCFFISLMLFVLAETTQKFFAARSRVAESDQESQLLRSLSTTLVREVETAQQVTSATPDLVLRRADSSDATRLPPVFPTPDPSPTPLWDPTAGLLSVRYYFDNSAMALMREATFPDSSKTTQTVAESVTSFTVTNTTDRDFAVTIGYQTQAAHLLHLSLHLQDS